MSRRPSFVLALLGIFVAIPSVLAQRAVLEEIIVTATKRGAASLQDVPMSIEAFGQETLERMRVEEFTDFSRSVPGLDVVDVGPGQKRYLVRGINSAGEATVGLYYDNIPLTGQGDDASAFGGGQPDLDLFDTERVEVLRGPQGTLYGTSSVSGVVRIITNKPDATAFDSRIQVDGASISDGENSFSVKGMFNVPVVDDVFAIRGVAYVDEQGGYVDNVVLNKGAGCYGVQAPNPEIVLLDTPGCNDGRSNLQDVNAHRKEGARLGLQWNASDRTSILGQLIYQGTESDGRNATHPIDAVNSGPGFVRSVRGGSNEFFTAAAGERATNVRSQEPYDEDFSIVGLELNTDVDVGTFTLAASYMDRQAAIRLDSSNPARLHRSFAAAGIPPPINAAMPSPTDRVSLYQEQGTDLTNLEARFASSLAGRTNFLAGLFYQDKTIDVDSQGRITDPATGLDLPQAQTIALLQQRLGPGGLATLNNPNRGWPVDPFLITHRMAENTTESTAVFGELYFAASEQWELMLGARWFDTERVQESVIIVPFLNSVPLQGAAPGVEPNVVAEEDDVLFKAQATYRPTENHSFYLQFAEGFRAGGTNARNVAVIPPQYESDQTENLELGAKTSWADGRLIANVSLYEINWQNVQFDQNFTQQFEALVNCTEQDDPIESQGIELSLQGRVGENLDIGLNYTKLDAEWNVDPIACLSPDILAVLAPADPGGRPVEGQAGDELRGVPDYSGSAFLQYNFPQAPGSAQEAFFRADVQYQGTVDRNDRDNATNVAAPSYTLVNLAGGFQWARYGLSLYVRNATDEDAWLSLFQGFRRTTVSRPCRRARSA